MAAATPKRAVHWDTNYPSPSEFGSPSLGDDDSTASSFAPSTLEYVNSQLIAHGFAPAPGLCLDGASARDSERVVKCLLSLLGQRMQDMSRTEDLSTKLRTLQYDHQRLNSMHRTAVETAANAEREMNLHKSKLQSTQRTLQNAEQAHKQTSQELQRTKTALQALRTTQGQELKKREKDLERMSEKWQKLADAQAKMTTSPSGIACVNVSAMEGRNSVNAGDLVEVALDEAERARAALVEDNKHLKTLVLKAVNSIQRILYQTKALLDDRIEMPGPYTITTLFPMSSSTTPNEKLTSLLSDLRDNLETVSERLIVAPPTPSSSKTKDDTSKSDEENQRLQKQVASLESELTRCQRQLESQAQELQTLLDTIEVQQRASDSASLSTGATPSNKEYERLEKLKNDLERERDRLRTAAVTFSQERATLETQRQLFLEEKQSWEETREKGRSFSPPLTPPGGLLALPTDPHPPPQAQHQGKGKEVAQAKAPVAKVFRAAKKSSSPRKSPAKFKMASKAGGSSKSSHAAVSNGAGQSKKKPKITLSSPQKVVPAFETELVVLPPLGRLSTLGAPPNLLPGAFVLPPPSPRASLPVGPALPPASGLAPLDFGSAKDPIDVNPFAPAEPIQLSTQTKTQAPPPSQPQQPQRSTTPQDDPSTPPPPTRKPFPVAKPFAQRMIHAYSPAKPSPLSRILTLAESKSSAGDITALPELSLVQEDVDEEVDWDQYGEGAQKQNMAITPEAEFSYDNDSDTAGSKDGPTGVCGRLPPSSAANPDRRAEDDEEESLAAQLGVAESPPQNTKAPLREKRSSNGARPPSRGATAPGGKAGGSSTAKGRVLVSEAGKKPARPPATSTSTAAKPKPSAPSSRKAVGSKEKENEVKKAAIGGAETGKRSPVFKPPPVSSSATAASGSGRPTSSAKPSSGKPSVGSARPSSSKAVPPAGGGPRRVLIDSSEAPVVRTKRT
ncbi:Afadin and alpha-actinin-binding-domain-containing protein [Coprinopsis sp. MPI-PUGE-AT-0042]|nr:Afadin and alpha-actinin-binding-domain-containing protein [Coprinopsis sp. MPI-PUGE-AT-0042]